LGLVEFLNYFAKLQNPKENVQHTKILTTTISILLLLFTYQNILQNCKSCSCIKWLPCNPMHMQVVVNAAVPVLSQHAEHAYIQVYTKSRALFMHTLLQQNYNNAITTFIFYYNHIMSSTMLQ